MKNTYSLIRGCALLRNHRGDEESYLLGTLERVATVTSPFQRSAVTQLALGGDPFADLPLSELNQIERFIRELDAHGFLNRVRSELTPPKRYLDEVDSRDRAAIQLRTRSAPELAQVEWADGKGDGGTSTLAARSQFPIELSGRSRVITLLYSILLASGVTRVRFAERFNRPDVSDLDVGSGPITANDLGLNYYQQLESQRRGLSLFPIALSDFNKSDSYSNNLSPAALVVHYGDCDPEVLIEWSQAKRPHLLIHQPIGDEIVVGPLVLPGESPCNRCLSLYEIDIWGFTRFERIPLTPVDDLPMVVAHYIAAIVASEILRFIDGALNSGGEVFYLNFQRLTSPQVVAISRHPLCGCDY
jgi:hypothetical protein